MLLNGLLDNRGMLLVGAAYGVLWEAGLFRGVWDQLARGAYGPGLVRDTAQTIAAGERAVADPDRASCSSASSACWCWCACSR